MKTKIFIIGLSALLLTGCYTPSSQMNQVHLGMSEKDVVKVMGEPVSRGESPDGSVTLYYSLQEIFGSPPMPYSVHLMDNKVDSYGRAEVDAPQRTVSPIIVPIAH
jgi:hypothetical protein